MTLLLDTQLLLWAANDPERLTARTRALLLDDDNELCFSAASVWEIAIKNAIGRDDFRVDTRLLRRSLLENGYSEVPITGEHAVHVLSLPQLHKDPFDRMLIAQAAVEGMTLLTSDADVARYPGPIRKV